MKLVRCEWAPSLVVEWLCGELEERGIPGPTYAHTLLSLLHHHYCPHPAPPAPTSASTPSTTSTYRHPLSRRHLDDFDLRDLDLDDLLNHSAHPDADLPDLAAFSIQQRGGSRRARKRYKVRQKQRVLTSEQLQKVAALQCLMSASDERYGLENLIEELCIRLKTAAENEHNAATIPCSKKAATKGGSQESINDTDESSMSTPEEQAEKYYAAFPPLSENCNESCVQEVTWIPGREVCLCVRENQKPPKPILPTKSEPVEASAAKMPRSYRKKGRDKDKREHDGKYDEGQRGNGAARRHHHVQFMWHGAAKHREKLCENYDTDSASEPERSGERRRKKFVGPLPDEDIGEGYIGDTSSRESSEDRDKGEQEQDKLKLDKIERGYCPLTQEKTGPSQEEWECMGDLLVDSSQKANANTLGHERCRLFERGSTSGGTSGSSSDVETSFTYQDQDEESVRQLERKISDTVAQVWGQASEPLGHGRGEHVWEPPSVEELTVYNAMWGFGLTEHGHNFVGVDQVPYTDVASSVVGVSEGWQPGDPWQTFERAGNNEPFLGDVCHSFQNKGKSLNDGALHSGLEKSIWSDCNANNIPGNERTVADCLKEAQLSTLTKNENCEAVIDMENNLCESFMKLGLENLWENNIDLDGVFTDYTSSGNLEYVSKRNSLQAECLVDSEHEKMMALVEDVCKSYESKEETSLDISLLKLVPSGPVGPQADLHHTESSGFSMVVPRVKSEEHILPDPSENLVQLVDHLSSLDTLTTMEEENLLTSPRTHFRPIRQESLGSTAEDHYEDGTMFIINSERPDLPFQRTSSGALFLESDLLEGSPKKYMVYKEPETKVGPPEEDEEIAAHSAYPTIALVPKFKVVNNEKFCQTETSSCETKETPLSHERVRISDKYHKSDDQEPDVFEFQHQDFPDSKNLANIWKDNSRNIWHINMEPNKAENWGQLSLDKTGLSNAPWLGRMGEGAVGWSCEGQFEPPPDVMQNQNSEKLANLWQPDPSESPTFAASIPNLQSLWKGIQSYTADEDDGRSKMYIINPKTHIPESCNFMSAIPDASLWKHHEQDDVDSTMENTKDVIWREKSSFNRERLCEVSTSKRDVGSGAAEQPGRRSEMRQEVDDEADELLGAVRAQTSGTLAHHGSNGYNLLRNEHSPRPLHERLKKCSSGNPVSKTKPSSGAEYKRKEDLEREDLEREDLEREDLEREDLDDLAPGWELNDGFEWEHQNSGDPDDEECVDGVDDDEVEAGDVLVYETEDGTTYTIPVEYLDDSLYDQIFGATDSGSQRLGGSLPDLPSGHPKAIRFSSELESEWKKSGIPYKVQLPRKPRPGRWIPPSRRPCTFFMEGSCRRNDCKFSHDLASITCRFWEEGSCLKGITCPFLHGYPLRRRRNKSEGAACVDGDRPEHHSSSFEIDSEMDFPTLGSSCESKPGCIDERSHNPASVASSSSHHIVTRKKKKKFITITKKVLGEVKNSEAERNARRRAALRKERRRRHTDTAGTDAKEPASTEPPRPATLRRAERHRVSASGHEDGTVSDY